MKRQGELSIIGAYGRYSKTPAKHAPVVGNSVLNLLINILGSGSVCLFNIEGIFLYGLSRNLRGFERLH